jgi:hypothetical protein
VLQYAMRPLVDEWKRKGYGIALGKGRDDRLTNLRFADDVVLVAGTKDQLQRMLQELHECTSKVGLQIHWGKTKCLSNLVDHERDGDGAVEVDGRPVQVLKYMESTMYLGRALCFGELHDAEIRHRMTQAWKKFMINKSELCCKHYPLQDRLKLFEVIVTQTALYGSGTWTMTRPRERLLRTTQRKMLRMILGASRRVEPTEASDETSGDCSDQEEVDVMEPWTEWIKRATHTVEKVAEKSWITRLGVHAEEKEVRMGWAHCQKK